MLVPWLLGTRGRMHPAVIALAAKEVLHMPSRKLLAVFLIITVFLCHGVLGTQHQFSSLSAVPGQPQHTGATDTSGASLDSSKQPDKHPLNRGDGRTVDASGYTAAFFTFLILGTGLALFGKSSYGSLRRRRISGLLTLGRVSTSPFLACARGPTITSLQVFRL